MADPTVSIADQADNNDGWLLLITEVPSKPDYLRVKLRRRVQRLGAVGLKGAVYVLPEGPETVAGFQSLRRAIFADGGDATLCSARLIAGMTNTELVALFNRDRDAEYVNFVSACEDLAMRWEASGAAVTATERHALVAERARHISRLEEILGRDHFGARRREDAMQAIERLAVLDIARAPLRRTGADR